MASTKAKRTKIFRSIEDVRATFLPQAIVTFGANFLDDPVSTGSVLASHLMRDLAATVTRARKTVSAV
jgi:hypothetical protein